MHFFLQIKRKNCVDNKIENKIKTFVASEVFFKRKEM